MEFLGPYMHIIYHLNWWQIKYAEYPKVWVEIAVGERILISPVEHSVDPTTLQASTKLWMHFHAENPFVKHILPALPEINTKLRQTKAFLISPGLLAEMLQEIVHNRLHQSPLGQK